MINKRRQQKKKLKKIYKLKTTEAMLLMNRFELAKLHTHIDEMLFKVRDIHAFLLPKKKDKEKGKR